MADDDRGPQYRHRHPAEPEQLLHIAARPQMRRQVVVQVAETTEIDDLPQSGVLGSMAERGRGLGVPLLEVVGIE